MAELCHCLSGDEKVVDSITCIIRIFVMFWAKLDSCITPKYVRDELQMRD